MQNSSNLQQQAKSELAKRELARRHLKDFAKYTYDGYLESWHTNLLCEALEEIEKRNIRFLFIELPPRHSKSVHVSQIFPAWAVGRDKDVSVIVSSYSGDLATDHGRETRNLMSGPKYQNVFQTRLAGDSNAKGKWNTDGKGAYNAVGVGGSVTGKGADFFVIDDPFKDRKEVDSVLIRDDRWRWFRSVARTRLTPNGCIIIMHTRWHDDDLIGRLTEGNESEPWVDWFEYKEKGIGENKWVRLRLPAIADKDEKYRKQGEALWPKRYGLEELMDIKKSVGGYEWSALYQQDPVDEENRIFKPEWFRYKDVSEVDGKYTANYLTVDTKSTADKHGGSDYIGLCLNFVDSENNWHIRAERKKMSAKELVDLLFNWYERYQLASIGLEKTAFTEGLKTYIEMEERARNKFLPIVELSHGGTRKEMRIEGLSPRYERGAIYHLKQGTENLAADVEEELLRFPNAKNDDASDAEAYQLQLAEPAASESFGEMLSVTDGLY